MLTPRISSDLDRPLLITTVLLALIGIAFVYSATMMPASTVEHGLYLRQFIWLAIALGAGALAAAVPYRIYEGKTSWLFYGIGIALLLLTLIIGHVGLGAQRWLGWGRSSSSPPSSRNWRP